jgi:hypothetical protein
VEYLVGIPHEEHDKEDPEASLFSQLEQSIATLKELVTQLLVMKGKEAHSIETEHGEHKATKKIPKVRSLET